MNQTAPDQPGSIQVSDIIDPASMLTSGLAGTLRRPGVARLILYVLICAIVSAVWLIQARAIPFISSSTDSPSQWQQLGIQIASETTRLLTTLATALLGALGLFFANRESSGVKPRHMWSAFTTALCGALSLYYGYVVHLHLLWMITYKAFDPTSDLFLFPSHVQFYALLAGGFFFADFAISNLSEPK